MGPTELWSILSQTVNRVARRCRKDPDFQETKIDYSVWHILKVYLVLIVHQISPETLHLRLGSDSGLRKALGLPNRVVSESQFNKRLGTRVFLRALLELFRASAIDALKASGTEEVRVVLMDLTRIESSRKDSQAAWGKDSRGFFWGYRLGLIISEHGVVLGATLTRGNWAEFHVNRKLLKMAEDRIKTSFGEMPVGYLVCDSGFDGESTYKTAHETLRAPVICPARRERDPDAKHAKKIYCNAKSKTPHRLSDQKLWGPEWVNQVFACRNEIERVNGQIKSRSIRIQEIPLQRRGVRRLWPICLAKLFIYNMALNVNIAKGRSIRSIKDLVA